MVWRQHKPGSQTPPPLSSRHTARISCAPNRCFPPRTRRLWHPSSEGQPLGEVRAPDRTDLRDIDGQKPSSGRRFVPVGPRLARRGEQRRRTGGAGDRQVRRQTSSWTVGPPGPRSGSRADPEVEAIRRKLVTACIFLRAPDYNYLPSPDDIYVSSSQVRDKEPRRHEGNGEDPTCCLAAQSGGPRCARYRGRETAKTSLQRALERLVFAVSFPRLRRQRPAPARHAIQLQSVEIPPLPPLLRASVFD